MKLLTIREAWEAAGGELEKSIKVPDEVRDIASSALELRRSGTFRASIATVAKARALTSGKITIAALRRIEKALESNTTDDTRALLGGPIGERWVKDTLLKSQAERVELSKSLGEVLDSHRDGAPLSAFRELVNQHGHATVASALRRLGVEHSEGRVHAKGRAETTRARPAWRPFRFRGL